MEIHYDPRRFSLRVRDNGKGIDPEVLKRGRAGHYGLASMQERALGVGGKMAVWSEVGSGTEIELTITASIAYAKSTAPAQRLHQREPDETMSGQRQPDSTSSHISTASTSHRLLVGCLA